MTKYVGRMVSLMCENIRNNENGAVVKASDGVEITVALPPGESINGYYVQYHIVLFFSSVYQSFLFPQQICTCGGKSIER